MPRSCSSSSPAATLAVARLLLLPLAFGGGLPGRTLLVLGGWSLLAGSLAVWAYQRDEGRRYR